MRQPNVELSEIDVVKPDLLVVSRDRGLKRGPYKLRGLPVYWLVDPEAHTGTVFEIVDSACRKTGSHQEGVRLRLPGLEATEDLTRVW